MPDKRFAALLFTELQGLHDKRQNILDTCEILTRERGSVRRRIELLRELLTLEGTHLDLPDIFTEKAGSRG
jgi:hypothetical protein